MKKKIFTAVSIIMVLVPWSILPLRIYTQWALDYAHIMVPCYAAFMIFSGIFSIVAYVIGKVRNTAMKVCLVIHSAYAVFGAAVLIMMIAHHRENQTPASGDRTTITTENVNDCTDIKVARCSDGNISCSIVSVRT